MIEAIKASLPNFPDEVITDWILPYATELGWPPVHERWVGILYGRDIDFWKQVRWEKVTLDLGAIHMSPTTNSALIGLHQAFVLGHDNAYSAIENGKARHDRAFRYLVEHGNIPKPLCLLQEGGSYSVVDGNHRIVAYKTFSDMTKALGKLPPEASAPLRDSLRTRWGITEPATFRPEQEVWVAVNAE